MDFSDYVWDFKVTVYLSGGFFELVTWVEGLFEILRVLRFYFRTVGFYLGRGVTWVPAVTEQDLFKLA